MFGSGQQVTYTDLPQPTCHFDSDIDSEEQKCDSYKSKLRRHPHSDDTCVIDYLRSTIISEFIRLEGTGHDIRIDTMKTKVIRFVKKLPYIIVR